MSDWIEVGEIKAIPRLSARVIETDQGNIAVFRTSKDEIFALEDRCPHAGASLTLGSIEGDVVRCRIHHWGFCLRDGVYVDEDKHSCNARSFGVRIVNDQIQVCATK